MMDIEAVKKINEKLMDDESKKVYASRVLYSITGDSQHLYNLGNEFKASVIGNIEWKHFLDKLKTASNRGLLYLYGAGAYGGKMLELTPEIKWKGVIDRSTKIDCIRGVAVKNIDEFFDTRDGAEVIVIPSKRYYEEMRLFLTERGIAENNIIDGTILYDLTEGKQYFDLQELPYVEGKEVFLDIGCCDGMSSVQFMKWCRNEGYCYCFEPDKKNIEILKENLKAKGMYDNNYTLIPKGAWDEEGKLSFVASGNGSSHVAGVYGSGENIDTESIEVTTIDNIVGDVPVSFIKMDIEGPELNALRGADSKSKTKACNMCIP